MSSSDASDAASSRAAMQSELNALLKFPFACRQAVDAHEECTSRRHWRECVQMQQAMDACVDASEQVRFRGDIECRRWRRLYQSCILESSGSPSECDRALRKFHSCVVEAVR